MTKLHAGEPVEIAVRADGIGGNATQGGTFLRDLGDGYVEVWVGSRARRMRRDHVHPSTRRAAPVKAYERLYGSDD